jgi:hypothetical protein
MGSMKCNWSCAVIDNFWFDCSRQWASTPTKAAAAPNLLNSAQTAKNATTNTLMQPSASAAEAGTFCGKHVSERHVFEPHILAYVVVVGNVDTGRNT